MSNMPNMVDNILRLVGPRNRLACLAGAAREGRFLQEIKPLSRFAADRAIEAWGTKWDIRDPYPDLIDDDDLYFDEGVVTLNLQFESPWAAPLGAYEILTDEGIMVEAFYVDTSGLDFGGKYFDGEHHSYPLKYLPMEIITIFQELYDYDRLMLPTPAA